MAAESTGSDHFLNSTINYYDRNAEGFCRDTFELDMTDIYQRFLSRLHPGAFILDAGCGSGRDSKVFTDLGYRVDAFDASEQIVRRARLLTGLKIQCRKFEEVDQAHVYDGIWSCASLLHVAMIDLLKIMNQLTRSLRYGGAWYLSFKYGYAQREKDGRHFTDIDEKGLALLVSELEDISIAEIWVTKDRRPNRTDQWLNAILKKK